MCAAVCAADAVAEEPYEVVIHTLPVEAGGAELRILAHPVVGEAQSAAACARDEAIVREAQLDRDVVNRVLHRAAAVEARALGRGDDGELFRAPEDPFLPGRR